MRAENSAGSVAILTGRRGRLLVRRIRALIRRARGAKIWCMGRKNGRQHERPSLAGYLIGTALTVVACAGIGWLFTRQPLHGAETAIGFGVGTYAAGWWLSLHQQRAKARRG